MDAFPLLQLRVLSDLKEFVQSRKDDVARGALAPELAALEVETYGYGLAKALEVAEELFDTPRSGLRMLVDRLVLEIDPDAEETRNRRLVSGS